MSRHITLALIVVCAFASSVDIARANGVPAAPPAARATTPAEMAVEAYNSGIASRNRALKAETQAAKDTKDGDRAKNEKKAREEFEKAFKSFQKAAELNPTMPQAWNGMGYAYRKLGDYARALESYDRALTLAPNFTDAIEYRGEAYLGLDRLDDAKAAYLALFSIDRKQAETLMQAMVRWVEKRTADPSSVDPSAVAAFDAWVKERSAIARQTRLMGRDAIPHRW